MLESKAQNLAVYDSLNSVLFLYLMTVDFTENTGEEFFNKLICEACGREFSCGANAEKCWCFAVDLPAETLAELRENFQKCLCEDCLNNYSNPKSNP